MSLSLLLFACDEGADTSPRDVDATAFQADQADAEDAASGDGQDATSAIPAPDAEAPMESDADAGALHVAPGDASAPATLDDADAGAAPDSSSGADSALEPADAGPSADTAAPADAAFDPAEAGDGCVGACTPAFVPVRFSTSDRSACAQVSASGFEVEFVDWGPCGVRSDAAVAPGAGVFYFEAHRLVPAYKGGSLGIATAQATLSESAGASAHSAGVLATGAVQSAGGRCTGTLDPQRSDVGVVLDYRGASPTLHLLQADPGAAPTLRASCATPIQVPVYLFYSGDRAKVGPELALNTGADTTNFPFQFDAAALRTALAAAGQADAADALVMGFGATHAEPPDAPPLLTTSADRSVALGQQVSLSASALDPEEGALDAQIEWLDVASPHHAPVRGSGPSFTFTPSSIGVHPILVSVRDRLGVSATRTVRVAVSGALPAFAPVQLVRDAGTGAGITLSPDGLSASFRGTGKDGIRANQGLYGGFWYFEVHRDSAIRNMGMGLVTADGALNPYEPARVPWSCSLNVMRGFWIDLIDAGDWARQPSDADYGFAVDYRGEQPRVHILIRNALQTTLELEHVWLPLYPMLYGNPPEVAGEGSDLTINFGAKPFVFDARAVLAGAGVDTTGFVNGWGSAAQP